MKEECFLVCPIGEKESEDRKRSDTLLKHILKPILDSEGYEPIRADKMAEGGMITTQIINKIISVPLVIADLTNSNPNVFYELALRHSVNMPYIQLIDHNQKIPFDVSGIRTIHYNLSDLDSVDQTKSEILSQIKSIKAGHKPDSPISLAIKSEALGIPSNTLEVFLEKFWNIEDDLIALKESFSSFQEYDLESVIESAVESKLDDAVDKIITAIEEKT